MKECDNSTRKIWHNMHFLRTVLYEAWRWFVYKMETYSLTIEIKVVFVSNDNSTTVWQSSNSNHWNTFKETQLAKTDVSCRPYVSQTM